MLPSEEKAWLKYYKPGAKDIVIPNKTLYRFLVDETKGYENLYALNYFGHRVRYGELIEMVDNFANKFVKLGIKKGEHVVFLTVNLPETYASFYALNKIGAIPVLVEPRMAKERIEYFIKMVNAKVVIMLDIVYPKIWDIVKKLNVKTVLVQKATSSLPLPLHALQKVINAFKPHNVVPYGKTYMKFRTFRKMECNVVAEEVPFKKKSVAVVTQTGGTTGFPKGVMLTNEGLNAVALGFRYANIDVMPGETFLNIMPIFTSYGVVCGVHMSLSKHVEGILVPNFSPKKFPRLMATHKPAAVIAVPAFYEMLLKSSLMRKADLSNLKFAVSGGDLMNPTLESDMNRFFREHGCRYFICQGYGLSETSAVTAFSHHYKKGSVGLPLCTSEMGIFNPDTLEELPYGASGEICVSGPSIMNGYIENKEETAGVLKKHKDGKIWVHSGDLGYFDKDGFLFFAGRIKFVIPRFDGHKNFPVQIESAICKYPLVKNCCVVAIKDLNHRNGMWPLAIVELKETVDVDIEEVRREIKEFCKKNIEERGQPIDVIIEHEIPLTFTGKNDVVALTKKYANYDYRKNK